MAFSLSFGAPKRISNMGSHLLAENSGSHIKSIRLGENACKHLTHKMITSVKLKEK